MRELARLGQLRGLARLQEALTADASIELADARTAERLAIETAQDAAAHVEDMAGHWYRHLQGPLMPERGRAIAAMLVERERSARQSDEQSRQASDHTTDRERLWRAADAAERATHRVVGQVRRRGARKAEERALDALADRVTIDWMNK
jgi:hypothetical protein